MRWTAGAVFLAVAMAGCGGGMDGPPVQPVKGNMLRDGKPVGANWVATFIPDQDVDVTISGMTDANGHFEVRTIGADGKIRQGAPIGNYRVQVVSAIDDKQGGLETIDLPKKYEVKAGPNDLTLDLPKK
jgi:hypothetical protein